MLSPFDIHDRITKIFRSKEQNPLWNETRIHELHIDVLREIAKGSIDPKSIAKAALEILPDWAKQE